MKLRLKDRELPPVQLRLSIPAPVKETLEQYVGFVRGASGREVGSREVAVEILAQFMESDHEFKQWQKRGQKLELQQGQVNGQVSA
jgi:hypothetical protein